jgi:hypothetical protein
VPGLGALPSSFPGCRAYGELDTDPDMRDFCAGLELVSVSETANA